ncbi:MAG TPA: cytochrome c [Candidatus Binataceae bacterium]|nr:cytochrome c [Candidatus Binataceae bacterium]
MRPLLITFGITMVCALLTVAAVRSRADNDTAQEYTMYCAKCHGWNGRGDGTYASKLHQKPRDFANCAVMAKISDATIVKAIEEGGAAVGLSDEMPGWQGALDEDDAEAMAKYIRGFCKNRPGSQ